MSKLDEIEVTIECRHCDTEHNYRLNAKDKKQIKDLMLEVVGPDEPLMPRSDMELPRDLYANVEQATRYALRDKLRQKVNEL